LSYQSDYLRVEDGLIRSISGGDGYMVGKDTGSFDHFIRIEDCNGPMSLHARLEIETNNWVTVELGALRAPSGLLQWLGGAVPSGQTLEARIIDDVLTAFADGSPLGNPAGYDVSGTTPGTGCALIVEAGSTCGRVTIGVL
jgi:hypothetical protein